MVGFLSGLAGGLQTGIANKQRRQSMQLQERSMQMQEEKFAMQKGAMARQRELSAGLSIAFKQGGPDAAVDFLKDNDYKAGLELEKLVLSRNQSILSNQGSKLDNSKKSQELLTGMHGMIAGIGSQILQLPQDKQKAAYKANYELIKKLDPTMPKNFNQDAAYRFMASLGAATPAAAIYKIEKEASALKGQQGDLLHNFMEIKKRGVDPEDAVYKAAEQSVASISGDLAKKKAEAAGKLFGKDKVDNEDKLNGQWLNVSKDFRQVQDAYNRIKEAGTNPTAAGDLALIFNYMKMLDPGSTVREGEFANAQNSGGIPDRIQAMYNNAMRGERLSSRQRTDFLGRSAGLLEAQEKSYNQMKSEFESLAQERGLSKDFLIDAKTKADIQSGLTVEVKRQFIKENQEMIQQIKQQYPSITDEEIVKQALEFSKQQRSQ